MADEQAGLGEFLVAYLAWIFNLQNYSHPASEGSTTRVVGLS
jgi:hypothetical protein